MNEPPRRHRRDFLQGKAAWDAIASKTQAENQPGRGITASSGTGQGDSEAGYLLHISRPAMACQFDLILNAGRSNERHDTELAVAALDLLAVLEDQLSVYRDTSEVCRLNRLAGRESVHVEAGLFRLLQQSAMISRTTGGAFDITSTPLSKAWGFWRRAGRFPSPNEIDEARQHVGWEQIRLDSERQTVAFSSDGVEINLNAIGKGYAIDRCADCLEFPTRSALEPVTDFLIHGGQSSVLARGSRSGFDGWTISLRNPLRPEQRLLEFCLRNRALGTSGTGTQFFYHAGKRYGHIIDPRTGCPADQVLSSSAIASTAAEADALATAFYVMGWERTAAYCAEHPQIGAALILPGERQGAIEICTANIEESELKRL